MFLFSRFSELDVSHTPVVRRKRLFHLIETTPIYKIYIPLRLTQFSSLIAS